MHMEEQAPNDQKKNQPVASARLLPHQQELQ